MWFLRRSWSVPFCGNGFAFSEYLVGLEVILVCMLFDVPFNPFKNHFAHVVTSPALGFFVVPKPTVT